MSTSDHTPKPNHGMVVVGLTKDKSVLLHDPASGPMVVKPEAFQTWWAKKDNLTVLVATDLDPGEASPPAETDIIP